MNLSLPTSTVASFALIFSAACSDPPSPPAQGAVAETIQPNASGNGCTPAGPPFAAPPLADAITGTAASLGCDTSQGGCKPDANVVVDGDQGASVSCSVSGSGPFAVQASLSQGIVALNILGTVSATGGKVNLSSTHAGFSLRDEQCDIFIEPNKGEIKPGAIWARFDCENFADPSIATPPGCAAVGKFIFENCSQ